MTNETSLCEWNSVNQSGSFVIGVTSDKLYGLSSQFHVYYNPTASPTQSPTMSPTYAPTTQNPTNTPTYLPSYRPTTIPTTQTPTILNKNNENNENNDDSTLWIVLITLFAAIIVISGCMIYIFKGQPANQTRPLSPHQQNTTAMYHNRMANIPNHIPNNQFYSTGYNSNNHYEATPEPSPTVPTSVYVTQQPNLYPNIDVAVNSIGYSRTQFSSDVRAVKNNSYEKTPDNQHIYDRIKSPPPPENLYDRYNLENETFDC
jgi:hypothetical protein